MIVKSDLKRIEKKFNIKLYDWQIDYLLNNGSIMSDRCNGKTFVYIIKLLTDDMYMLDLTLLRYTDEPSLGNRYRDWFIKEVFKIYYELVECGVNCRPIMYY